MPTCDRLLQRREGLIRAGIVSVVHRLSRRFSASLITERPAGRAISLGKYQGCPEAVDWVARASAQHCPVALIDDPPMAIVDVPATWKRSRRRGISAPSGDRTIDVPRSLAGTTGLSRTTASATHCRANRPQPEGKTPECAKGISYTGITPKRCLSRGRCLHDGQHSVGSQSSVETQWRGADSGSDRVLCGRRECSTYTCGQGQWVSSSTTTVAYEPAGSPKLSKRAPPSISASRASGTIRLTRRLPGRIGPIATNLLPSTRSIRRMSSSRRPAKS